MATDKHTTWPAWKMRMILRFEEFDSGVLKDRVPPKATKSLDGIKDDGAALEVVPDPDKPGRFLIQAKGSGRTGAGEGPWFDQDAAAANPVAPSSSSDGLTFPINGVIPIKFGLKRNGIRTPDELAVVLRWCDFPFDPRAIRSCAVEFYLGSLTLQEFAQGQRGLTRGDVFGPGVPNAAEPMNIIPDNYVDANGNRRSNRRFQGWVEKHHLAWSEDQPVVELECRDNTQLLQNQIAPPKLTIAANKPLDEAIATYLSNFPQCQGMTVEYLGDPESPTAPILKQGLEGTAFKPELGPSPSKGGGDSDDLMIWDYITDVCGAVGHVCYVDDSAIVIARPFTILGGYASKRRTDPYVSRTVPEGELQVRTMVFGRNLKSLEFTRDFASNEGKNVELRAWNPRRKQVMVARYPEKADRVASAHVGDSVADNKWNIIRLRMPISDQKLLKQMAKDYYSGHARSELEAVMKTDDLYSYGGDAEDTDLLDLQATDPIQIEVDHRPGTTVANVDTAATANPRFMERLGYHPALATAYSNVLKNAGFQKLFRVSELTIDGEVGDNGEGGVTMEIHAKNFVQVRGEKET